LENRIRGLARGVIQEVVKADITMHEMQIEEWARLARHSPRGDYIPRDLMKGFARDHYLSLNEVVLEMNIKPLPIESFWRRLVLGTKLIFGRSFIRDGSPFLFDFCQSDDDLGQKLKLIIKRLDDGKLAASYEPSDSETATLMKE